MLKDLEDCEIWKYPFSMNLERRVNSSISWSINKRGEVSNKNNNEN